MKRARGATRAAPRCAAVGARSTRQLEATRRALCASREHPTAERLFRLVRKDFPSVSRGTVYRNLQKLLEVGEARQLKLSDRAARYDGRIDDHDHFVCLGCGAVVDVEPRSGRRIDPFAVPLGCAIERIAVTYHGRCPSCISPPRASRRPQASRTG